MWKELPKPFELIERAYEQYLWSGDRKWIDDPEVFQCYTNIMTKFLDLQDTNNNGVAYEKESLCIFREQEVDNFIEAGDSIASQYADTLAYSKILEAHGDISNTKEYEKQVTMLLGVELDYIILIMKKKRL